jgi:hypothetical protein
MHDVLHVQGGEEGERTKLVRVFVCCAACTCVLHTNTRAHFHPSSFACELVESEVLPEPGSTQEAVFAEIDLATTILFTVELCFNLFAHSEHHFREFIVQRANWFDAFIVAISLFNVVLQATGASLPNAKVHAHTPSHAHALTCAETPAPECHKHKHKHRHARACVHAQRRIAAKRIITLPKHTHTHTHTHTNIHSSCACFASGACCGCLPSSKISKNYCRLSVPQSCQVHSFASRLLVQGIRLRA